MFVASSETLQSINKTKCAADYGDLIRSQGDFKNKNLGESNLELETTAALLHKEIIDLRPEIFLPPHVSQNRACSVFSLKINNENLLIYKCARPRNQRMMEVGVKTKSIKSIIKKPGQTVSRPTPDWMRRCFDFRRVIMWLFAFYIVMIVCILFMSVKCIVSFLLSFSMDWKGCFYIYLESCQGWGKKNHYSTREQWTLL